MGDNSTINVKQNWYRDLWLLVVTGAVCYVLIFALPDYLQRQEDEVNRTTRALCIFRGDLERRVQDSRAYLKAHPEGFPGISAAQIQQGIDNQQDTVDSLQSLQCPPK